MITSHSIPNLIKYAESMGFEASLCMDGTILIIKRGETGETMGMSYSEPFRGNVELSINIIESKLIEKL